MIENSLVYIHSASDPKVFVGCGVVVEGGYIATCHHVWAAAISGHSAGTESLLAVPVIYPASVHNGAAFKDSAQLAADCRDTIDASPVPDLVLLQPLTIPSGILALQVAAHFQYEVGPARVYAGIRRDPKNPNVPRGAEIAGNLLNAVGSDGRRQFTGSNPAGFWLDRGSSGSPTFLTNGMQLAGLISLSELGANEGASHLHEAFVVPGTTIRKYLQYLSAQPTAKKEHLDAPRLKDIMEEIRAADIPVSEIPNQLRKYISAVKTRAAEVTPKTDGDNNIHSVIKASREKLASLDTAGARELLQSKINQEMEMRLRPLLPLLKERAAIERLAFDYAAAHATLVEITRIEPDDVEAWIELGDLRLVTGTLE